LALYWSGRGIGAGAGALAAAAGALAAGALAGCASAVGCHASAASSKSAPRIGRWMFICVCPLVWVGVDPSRIGMPGGYGLGFGGGLFCVATI